MQIDLLNLAHQWSPPWRYIMAFIGLALLWSFLSTYIWARSHKKELDEARMKRRTMDDFLDNRRLRFLEATLMLGDIKRHPKRLKRIIRQRKVKRLVLQNTTLGDGLRPIHEPRALSGMSPSPVLRSRSLSPLPRRPADRDAASVGGSSVRSRPRSLFASGTARKDPPRRSSSFGSEDGNDSAASFGGGASGAFSAEAFDILQRVSSLSFLGPDVAREISRSASRLSFSCGEKLLRLGEQLQVPAIYLLEAGAVEVRLPSGMLLHRVKGGQMLTSQFALLAGLTRTPLTTHVELVAVEDSRVLKLDPQCHLPHLLLDEPELAVHMVQAMASRLQQTMLRALTRFLGLSPEIFRQVPPCVPSGRAAADAASHRCRRGVAFQPPTSPLCLA